MERPSVCRCVLPRDGLPMYHVGVLDMFCSVEILLANFVKIGQTDSVRRPRPRVSFGKFDLSSHLMSLGNLGCNDC